MAENKSRVGFLIIGLIGIALVLIGLDLYTYNYSGELISSIYNSIQQENESVGSNLEPKDTGMLVETPIRPTTPVRPTNTLRPSSPSAPLPTNTAKPMPTSTATQTLGPSPTDASWRACPGIYRSHLHIGDQAYVSYEPPLPNRVRKNPNTSAQVLGRIQPGEEVDIVDGPACSNGWVWWKVSSLEKDLIGWTSEGDGRDYWLIKIED